MKNSVLNLVAAICLVAACVMSCAGSASCVSGNGSDEIEECGDCNEAVDEMFFSSEYVVGEYVTGTEFIIVYSDSDANLCECPINVDAYTYAMVLHAITHKTELVGHLVETEKAGIFTYVTESELYGITNE